MGFLKPPKIDLPQTQAAPPVPPLAVAATTKPKKKPMTPTMLGEATTPGGTIGEPSGMGGKTLLGA